jgi:hypothetical protein
VIMIPTPNGKWQPASGYCWVSPEDPSSLDVRVWAGVRLTGVDAAGNSLFEPAPGYVWWDREHRFAFDIDHYVPAADPVIKLRPDLRVAETGLDDIGVSFWPAPGYAWAGDPNTLVTTARPDLRISHYFDDGTASFVPASGYVWAGDPDTLVTRVRPDLRISHYFNDGTASFIPAPPYMWVGDPNNLVTRLKPHIVEVSMDPDGPVFQPATGYGWVNPDDDDNFDVAVRKGIVDNGAGFSPAPGYVWVSPDANDLTVRVADRGDAHPSIGSNFGGTANRSPAMNPELKKDLKAVAVQAARVAAGSVIGGVAGKVVTGSPVGVIVGGLLSSTPTAEPHIDMTHQPGQPQGGNGGGGGNAGRGGDGSRGAGQVSGGGHTEPHHEGAGSFR